MHPVFCSGETREEDSGFLGSEEDCQFQLATPLLVSLSHLFSCRGSPLHFCFSLFLPSFSLLASFSFSFYFPF